MNRNMMMLSTTPWNSPYKFRRQHFSRVLAGRGWKVFYVDPTVSLPAKIRELKWRALWAGDHRGRTLTESEEGRLRVFKPRTGWPYYYRGNRFTRWGRQAARGALHRAARRFFGEEPYLQVLYNPFDYHLLRRELPVVFDIVDNWTSYPGMERAADMIRACQRMILQECRALVATTDSLIPPDFDRGRATVIPNGVSMSLYPESALNGPEPADLKALPRPRVIYTGALWEWFDFPLLAAVAEKMKDATFLLVGFNKKPLPPLPPNVRFLGPRKQTELPGYYAHCDVGLIPFREDELSLHVNPLKFYEYMAGGLPCVSVPMTPIRGYEGPGVLEIASGADAFERAIRAQASRRASMIAERRRIAAAHDWDALGLRFERVLEPLLSE